MLLASALAARRGRSSLASVYGMFTPAELPIGDEPTCGTERRDDPHGPGGADRAPRCRASPRSRPAGRWAACGSAAATPGSGSTPTRPATTPSRSRLRPPATCAARRARRGAERRAGHAPLRAARAAAAGAASHPHVRLRRRLRHLRFEFDGDATRRLIFDARRRAGVPAPRRRSSQRSRDRYGLALCGVGAPPCPGGREDEPLRRRRRALGVAVACARRRSSLAVVVTTVVAAPARHAARLGHGAARRRARLGRRRSLALGLTDWDWGADGLVLHVARDRHPGHDGRGRRPRPAGPTRLAGHR